MRVLICGDRNWDKPAAIEVILEGLAVTTEWLTVIEGCARGADKVACEWEDSVATHAHYPADWNTHHRAAGPIRNRKMLEEGQPDVVFAFHDNLEESKGTKDMVKIAHKAGVPVYVVSRYGS